MNTIEEDMCGEVMKWARLHINHYPCLKLLHHIPNEGRRAPRKAKKIGILSGVPDYSLPVARGSYHGFYMEVKKPKKEPSDNQLLIMDWLESEKYYVCWVDNLDDAFREIEDYCRLKR